MPENDTDIIRKLVDRQIERSRTIEDLYANRSLLQYICKGQMGSYKLLRVTAVLTALDDGTQALGQRMPNNQIVPVEPYLRNPHKHLLPEANYITDWIRQANLQLLLSGAGFGLDVENIRYELVENTFLHKRECTDDDNDPNNTADTETAAFLQNKAAENPSPDNPYWNSVVLLFRWGKGAEPALQACSGVRSPYILMAGAYDERPRYMDGQLVTGNNLLCHEFGHFMGLSHTFTELSLKLAGLADTGNPLHLPLTPANLPDMNNTTAQDLETRIQTGLDLIKTFPHDFDPDSIEASGDLIEQGYSVMDTPGDLGRGLPLLHGQNPCEGEYDYVFTCYDPADLEETKDVHGRRDWWRPKTGAIPSKERNVKLNDTVRQNVMSYWYCEPEMQRFTATQVTRMHYVLDHVRSDLIGRVIKVNTACKRFRPLPQLLHRILPPWVAITRFVFPGYWQLSRAVQTNISAYEPWQPERLQAYIKIREQQGNPLHPVAKEVGCGYRG